MTAFVYTWMAVLVAAVVLESVTMNLVAIWFVPGALLSLVLAACKVPFGWQALVFVLVSGAFLALSRTIFRKLIFRKGVAKTDLDLIIGQKVPVTEEINNLAGQGAVSIRAIRWSARAAADGEIIPVGTTVRVVSIEGAKVLVRRVSDEGRSA